MVIRNEVSKKVLFEDMELESVFMYGGKLYMKVAKNENIDEDDNNAYNLTEHKLTNFPADAKVELYKAELVIYGKDASVE